MKFTRFVSGVFGILGIAVAATTVFISLSSLNSEPVMMKEPTVAVGTAEDMIRAYRLGDFEEAGSMIYGNPSLGELPEDTDASVRLVWEAFLNSITYSFDDDYFASDSGVGVNMHFSCLDLSQFSALMQERAENYLNEAAESATNLEEVYDENHVYREDFIKSTLTELVSQILSEDLGIREQTIEVHMIFDQNRWWVMPEQELMNAMSGVITE